mmetsp:Transcript_1203/g.2436  ORF Transcript_1203/g.2436 Transcript_1203/m.2436 type:complete len:88 (-) Transcript_1203:340-603(-)
MEKQKMVKLLHFWLTVCWLSPFVCEGADTHSSLGTSHSTLVVAPQGAGAGFGMGETLKHLMYPSWACSMQSGHWLHLCPGSVTSAEP